MRLGSSLASSDRCHTRQRLLNKWLGRILQRVCWRSPQDTWLQTFIFLLPGMSHGCLMLMTSERCGHSVLKMLMNLTGRHISPREATVAVFLERTEMRVIDILPHNWKMTAEYFATNIVTRLASVCYPNRKRLLERKCVVHCDNALTHNEKWSPKNRKKNT
jgi:hypothetical protein